MGSLVLKLGQAECPFTFTRVGLGHDLSVTKDAGPQIETDIDLTGVSGLLPPGTKAPLHLNIKRGFGLTLSSGGVTVIMGGTATGKSTLAEILYIAANHNNIPASFIRYGEPEADSLLSTPMLISCLADALVGPEELIIWDSIRRIAFNSKGAAGKGGISMGLFNDLTSLSVVAQQLNKALVIILNPLISDAEYEKAYEAALNGSVRSTIVCPSPGVFHYSTRDESIHLTRTSSQYRFSAEDAALARKEFRHSLGVSGYGPMTTAPESASLDEFKMAVLKKSASISLTLPQLLTSGLLSDGDDNDN
jgi:energy-coupling factor transporter ATP-binding protein EcfA2